MLFEIGFLNSFDSVVQPPSASSSADCAPAGTLAGTWRPTKRAGGGLAAHVDADATQRLEVALGDAARGGRKGEGLFSDRGARAGYTLKHLAR